MPRTATAASEWTALLFISIPFHFSRARQGSRDRLGPPLRAIVGGGTWSIFGLRNCHHTAGESTAGHTPGPRKVPTCSPSRASAQEVRRLRATPQIRRGALAHPHQEGRRRDKNAAADRGCRPSARHPRTLPPL